MNGNNIPLQVLERSPNTCLITVVIVEVQLVVGLGHDVVFGRSEVHADLALQNAHGLRIDRGRGGIYAVELNMGEAAGVALSVTS